MAQNLEKLQAEFEEAMRYHQLGQVDEAETRYRKLMKKAPKMPMLYNNLGLVLQAQNRIDEAVKQLERAVKLDRQYVDAYSNLGNAYRRAGKFDAAIKSFERALKLNPAFIQALGNLGNTYLDMGRLEESEKAYRDGLALLPEQPDLYYNLGRTLYEQGRWDDAEESFRKTLSLNHAYPLAHWNLSHVMLLHGRFREGWLEYEWRWHCPGFTTQIPKFDEPRWDGKDISGKTLLVYAEQGFGDTIQFVRYLPGLSARGCRVIFLCQPELARLLRDISGIEGIVTEWTALPEFDLHTPLMSLPMLLGMKEETDIPSDFPYITPPADGSGAPSCGDGFNVGLVWAGRESHLVEAQRSLDLVQLKPLTEVAGCRFFALHEDDRSEELAAAGMADTVTDLSGQLSDFGDTARVIAGLDLVIGVDTAVVHLAGALNVPVWTMLAKIGDWRWMLEREDTPWYPAMRLFRQTERGDWSPVIARIVRELTIRHG